MKILLLLNYFKIVPIVLICILISCNSSISHENIDKTQTQDSLAIINLFSKTKTNKDSSSIYINFAKKIALESKSVKCEAIYLALYSREFIYNGQLDSAKNIAERGLLLDYDSTNIVLKGKFYNLKGQVEGLSKNIYQAIDYYLKAETFFLIGKDSSALAGIYSNIANAYFSLKDYHTANLYAKKAYALKHTIKENHIKANVITTYALSLIKTKHNKEALVIVTEADSIATITNNVMAKLASTIGFAEIYKSLQNYDSAKYYYNICINLSKKTGVKHFELMSRVGLLSLNEEIKNTNQIIIDADSTLLLATKMNNIDVLHTSKRIIGRAYAMQHNYQKGFQYLNESYNLYDSVAGIENQKNINEILVKYDTKKKENEILNQNYLLEKQKNSLRERQIFIVILILSIILLLVLIWYVRKVNSEKMKRFELEKQKTISDAYIKGEEKERERVSFEIHDGIAGMLTAVILKLQGSNPKNEESIMLLQQLHEDSRRISHNLMPIDFESINIITAIENVCYKISNSKTDISFLCKDNSINLNYQKSTLLYRIIQELINNALKHAKCKSVFVTVSITNNIIKTTVYDDGIGMHQTQIQKGLQSINERVKALNGNILIESELNQGTTITITHDNE